MIILDYNQLIFWGIFGLVVEVIFTAMTNLVFKKKYNLVGHTSIWMFPIYSIGLTYGFDIIQQILSNNIIRFLSYPFWIWAIEIIIGYPSSIIGIKIWDYSYLPKKYHWKGIVSYIHYPVWVLFGILVEFIDYKIFNL